MTTREGSNAKLVRYGYDALNRRDPERVLELLAPGAEFRFRAPGGGEEVLRGAEELGRFYDALFEIFDLVHLECRTITGSDDTVHAVGAVSLRARSTRQSTHANFRHTYRFRDGVIASAVFEGPVNPLELMRATDQPR